MITFHKVDFKIFMQQQNKMDKYNGQTKSKVIQGKMIAITILYRITSKIASQGRITLNHSHFSFSV